VWDEDKGENTKWELKKNPIVIERAVLDKIRAEIKRKENSGHWDESVIFGMVMALEIIDRYMEGARNAT
jgi:hypothetical protein